MTQRIFPILLNTYSSGKNVPSWDAVRRAGQCALIVGIPWAMIAPHEKQAESNHSQSLERLAERGGLDATEAVAVLEGRSQFGWSLTETEANARLGRMMVEFGAALPK